MITKSQHIELLKQVPSECFYLAKDEIQKIKNSKAVSWANIDLCYRDVAESLRPQPDRKLPDPVVYDEDGWYRFLDYINPRQNHIYEYIYKNELSLPKVYKNAIVNTRPSNIPVLCEPKIVVRREAINKYKDKFTHVAIKNREVYYDKYLNDCYNALKDLMTVAYFVPNKKFKTEQGSIVLRKELIDLLYSHNIIRDASLLTHYSPREREKVTKDIIQHKKAMFSELQR